MRISIGTQGFSLTEALRQHITRRLDRALQRRRLWVQHVEVHLGDTNGPRGGVDKSCSVVVKTTRLPVVVIRDLGADLYAVIDRAADRVGRTVDRRIAQRLRVKRSFGMRLESRAQLDA